MSAPTTRFLDLTDASTDDALRTLEFYQRWDAVRHSEDVPAGAERNAYRASLAVTALRAYADRVRQVNEPIATTIGDLISDLLHFADLASPLPPGSLETLDGAVARYHEEVDGE